MDKQQIRAKFQAAHGEQLQKVAAAQFAQMDAAANLANERTVLRELEKQFRLDMAAPDNSAQMELPLNDGGKKGGK